MKVKIRNKLLIFTTAIVLKIILLSGNLYAQEERHQHTMVGTASWYSTSLDKGPTASGEIYNQKKYTCATNHYKIGSWLKVTNILKGKSVVVRVNDKMARHSKRIIDLTKAAASKIGIIGQGLAKVRIEYLGKGRRALLIK